jgi:FkbM family methyltransferase
MKQILHFDDRENWVEIRINDVKESYCVPEGIQNDICVDIGGNVGAFSIVHSKDFKRIIAFEPSTYSSSEYQKNMNVNNLNNVEVIQLAVSDVSNKILHLKPWLFGNLSGNASTINSEQWDDNTYEEVQSISLEDIFEKYNISRINYLKVDCEGGEYDFLMNKDLTKIDYL